MNSLCLITKPQKDYELLDSGEGFKLERFGTVVLSRPDPQALWTKSLPQSVWNEAHAHFGKGWSKKKTVPASWNIDMDGNIFRIKLSTFKHVGIFPEQFENWQWIHKKISESNRKISVLNLFGYTGGATLAALRAGAEVCHVDGSKVSLSSAKENVEISGLAGKHVRWILDDVMTFLQREVKRGHTYDAIIMDPPAFGRGPDGEVWKIEEHFPQLMELTRKLLSEQPLFVLVNGYASGYSAIAYENALRGALSDIQGTCESGEVAILESKEGGRLLPAGIFARWFS